MKSARQSRAFSVYGTPIYAGFAAMMDIMVRTQ
jgi:hypothetical protein